MVEPPFFICREPYTVTSQHNLTSFGFLLSLAPLFFCITLCQLLRQAFLSSNHRLLSYTSISQGYTQCNNFFASAIKKHPRFRGCSLNYLLMFSRSLRTFFLYASLRFEAFDPLDVANGSVTFPLIAPEAVVGILPLPEPPPPPRRPRRLPRP